MRSTRRPPPSPPRHERRQPQDECARLHDVCGGARRPSLPSAVAARLMFGRGERAATGGGWVTTRRRADPGGTGRVLGQMDEQLGRRCTHRHHHGARHRPTRGLVVHAWRTAAGMRVSTWPRGERARVRGCAARDERRARGVLACRHPRSVRGGTGCRTPQPTRLAHARHHEECANLFFIVRVQRAREEFVPAARCAFIARGS